MRILIALLLGLAFAVPAASGVAAMTKTVTVNDSSLAPARVNILPGDSVKWQNTGRQPHSVVSDTNAWPPFVLRPGRGKTIRFKKAGCFRYKVDGRRSGLIAVSNPCAAAGGTTTPGQAIYRYDITVEGRGHTVQRHSGDTGTLNNANGTVDLEIAWKSAFRNVAVKKVTAAEDTFVIVNASGTFAPGTTEVKFSYRHARQDPLGPCDGSFSYEALASRVRIGGARARGLGAELTFGSQLTLAASTTLFNRASSMQKGACNGYVDFGPRWFEIGGSPKSDIVRGSLTWSDVDPITTLTVSVERRRAPAVFFPLDRLQAGDGFVIQTGPVRNEEPCHFGLLAPVCTETFTGFLRVKFTPRRA